MRVPALWNGGDFGGSPGLDGRQGFLKTGIHSDMVELADTGDLVPRQWGPDTIACMFESCCRNSRFNPWRIYMSDYPLMSRSEARPLAAAPRPQSPIESQLDMQARACSHLENVIDDLVSRLAPVTGQEMPICTGESEAGAIPATFI